MDQFIELLGYSLFGFTVGSILKWAVEKSNKKPYSQLKSVYESMGNILGMQFTYIITVLGNPSYVRHTYGPNGDGITVGSWGSSGYVVTLVFDSNSICIEATGKG